MINYRKKFYIILSLNNLILQNLIFYITIDKKKINSNIIIFFILSFFLIIKTAYKFVDVTIILKKDKLSIILSLFYHLESFIKNICFFISLDVKIR